MNPAILDAKISQVNALLELAWGDHRANLPLTMYSRLRRAQQVLEELLEELLQEARVRDE